jgi:hypothetical protein
VWSVESQPTCRSCLLLATCFMPVSSGNFQWTIPGLTELLNINFDQ